LNNDPKSFFPMTSIQNFMQKTKTLSIKFLTLIKVVCARSIKYSVTVPILLLAPFLRSWKQALYKQIVLKCRITTNVFGKLEWKYVRILFFQANDLLAVWFFSGQWMAATIKIS
jgi:hypothetical protein